MGNDVEVEGWRFVAFVRLVPLEELPARVKDLDPWMEQTVALVCRTDRRSAKAAAILAKAGFADVHVVRGGMTAWLANGWPVVDVQQ